MRVFTSKIANVRKDAKPSSSEDLSFARDEKVAEIAALLTEEGELALELQDSLFDSDRCQEIEARILAIRVTIPSKERTLSYIEAEIGKAEKRESVAKTQGKVDKQNAISARLAASLPARYNSTLSQFVAVLQEIKDDTEACDRLSREAREHGLVGLWSAEYRARKDFIAAVRFGWSSVTNAEIPTWDGGVAWPR